MKFPPFFSSVLYKFMRLWTTPVLQFHIRADRASVEFMPKGEPRQSVDERIEQIEAARLNLVEALDAMDELKFAAEMNKLELAATLQTLETTQTQSASAEKELEAVREIAKSDISVFQKLAGIPSRSQVAKERLIGFLLGIAASVLASAVWWALSNGGRYLEPKEH
jgi:hypothetical protein